MKANAAAYHRCSVGTVEPTTTLTDQLGSRLWYISRCLAGLDVCQSPLIVPLRHQLETQDTILSQEHVLGEDIHAVDTLRAKSVGK